jgi:hypothetical protein
VLGRPTESAPKTKTHRREHRMSTPARSSPAPSTSVRSHGRSDRPPRRGRVPLIAGVVLLVLGGIFRLAVVPAMLKFPTNLDITVRYRASRKASSTRPAGPRWRGPAVLPSGSRATSRPTVARAPGVELSSTRTSPPSRAAMGRCANRTATSSTARRSSTSPTPRPSLSRRRTSWTAAVRTAWRSRSTFRRAPSSRCIPTTRTRHTGRPATRQGRPARSTGSAS